MGFLFFFLNILVFWALPKGNCPYQSGHRLRSSDKGVSSDPDPWNNTSPQLSKEDPVPKNLSPRSLPRLGVGGGMRVGFLFYGGASIFSQSIPLPWGRGGGVRLELPRLCFFPPPPALLSPRFIHPINSRRSSKRSVGTYPHPRAPKAALSGSPNRIRSHRAGDGGGGCCGDPPRPPATHTRCHRPGVVSPPHPKISTFLSQPRPQLWRPLPDDHPGAEVEILLDDLQQFPFALLGRAVVEDGDG